ncbi:MULTISPECIES: NAD(P)/FAD-dependent oxidoreductase [unclassified Acinetobacter]|uniref:NAD(P)/FAD-dependent oxidoreductase n=1 Tax=unclassified Acinetobacter TaxID=196816 RepID=UPI002934A1F2|nr:MULTISPECIES: FAD-dependent oxidoreductase [unclassified Acinetobacter]WOE32974.1 FAD-dependent oxidoreductase [Acinetobacter sp. SAAs470]WOE38452.1 FAD-dependent oxidoreductase [Acinetobacter sp. SAAs474]
MHIAIIGAGISGLMSALELLDEGCSITIFDQQMAAKAASWAGGGILSPMYPWRYDPAINRLAQHAQPLYQAWNEKIKPISGIDFEIHETGMLILDQNDFEIGLQYAQRYHEPLQYAQHITAQSLYDINPRLNIMHQHALYFPYLANIRNPKLLQSIVQYLMQHPRVTFQQHCRIEKLHRVGDKIQSIRNQSGQSFYADQFILTTGAWSEHWSEQLELNIPIVPVQGQMVLFKTPAHWLPTMCMNQVMYLIPRTDGHIVCGSSMRHVGFNTTPDEHVKLNILDACFDMVPELKQFPILQQWAGLRPGSPEGIPYIGKFSHLENLWANFGHFRNGLCMGPASAKLLKQLMFNLTPLTDASAYSPSRLQRPMTSLA